MEYTKIEKVIADRTLTLETGKMAKQAEGACVATYGETMVLATVQSAPSKEDTDFFPLTVEYREKTYAAGKIPGGFYKREGRPSPGEILAMRLIDRAIRPLFPEGYTDEVQIIAEVLATDQENEPDWIAMIAAFAALEVSPIPFNGPLGACRIGLKNGKFLINPKYSDLTDSSNKLNLTVAGSFDGIIMVEAGAGGVPEEQILEALDLGENVCKDVCRAISELKEKAGKPKKEFIPPQRDDELYEAIKKEYKARIREAMFTKGKQNRMKALYSLMDEAVKQMSGESEEDKEKQKKISKYFEEVTKETEREIILEGKRVDGRGWEEIRPISIEIGLLPRVHGSALFTRGETQALVTTTLGTVEDEQIVDGLFPEYRKKFLLHYNFPPFCVGEVKPIKGVSRREIGHGALAEKALTPVLPDPDHFPYTIRVVSDILESNGSSSMATVCGGCLALMDAGVPLKNPVAGIAMGLVMGEDKVAILSDIIGSEDHCGDMDFKVAGTQKGITALQMDIKCQGLNKEILKKALAQAKEGRMYILRKMLSVLRTPRHQISPHAPRLIKIHVNPERIGAIIGPGGKNIRRIQEETDTTIEIEDDGAITISGPNQESVKRCREIIEEITSDVVIGKIYEGKVVALKEFGAFIEILPGQEGLCHVSEMSSGFVKKVSDIVKIGEKVRVKVLGIDEQGRIKLSMKAASPGKESLKENSRVKKKDLD